MRLTVAIPTYNRNRVLCESVKHLLPQLTAECELLIIDNHSDVPIEESLRDILAAYPNVQHRIVRNRSNIGGPANLLRCFELCDTPWIWLLGDDDHPTPDAVSVILQHVESQPNCRFFNFVAPHWTRTDLQIVTGLDEFVQKFDSWDNLNFMSVGVFHRPTVMPQLRLGYQYLYSMSPQLVMLLASLGENVSCCFSDKCIIEHQSPAGWGAVHSLLGKMTILDLPLSDTTRRELARKLRRKPSLEATAVILLHTAQEAGNCRRALYQYDQICSRMYYFDRSWFTQLRISCYRLLVRFHRLGHPLLEAAFPALSRFAGMTNVSFDDLRSPGSYQRL